MIQYNYLNTLSIQVYSINIQIMFYTSDIDECDDPELSGCEDLCVDTEGSYHCECSGDGLKLSWNGKSCSGI